MQTFLPYPDYAKSAAVLDTKRLIKQRSEVLQILDQLSGKAKGFTNMPGVKMWRDNEFHLITYGMSICNECSRRGLKDDKRIGEKIKAYLDKYQYKEEAPSFIGDEAFHLSHKSNLIRIKADYYKVIFGTHVPEDLEYVWPGRKTKEKVQAKKVGTVGQAEITEDFA